MVRRSQDPENLSGHHFHASKARKRNPRNITLYTDKAAKKSLIYDRPKGGTKPARLHYRTLEVNEHGVLLEIKPSTGRFHQIRAQLSHIGCPIVGDEKYGGSKLSTNTIALHAWKIKLPESLKRIPY